MDTGPAVIVLVSESEAETDAIAARVAGALRPGMVLAIEGQMGAGKTRFVRGLVAGMGGDPRAVSSPTFVLLNIYDTPAQRVYHIDAYRLAGPDDLDSIGFDELLQQGGVVAVEWASRIAAALPEKRVSITIASESESRRRLEIIGLPNLGTAF